MDALRADYVRRSSESDFDCLIKELGWGGQNRTTDELALECGKSTNAFTSAVHRLKRRFGECIRSEVSQVVTAEEDVEDELRYYLKLFPDSFV